MPRMTEDPAPARDAAALLRAVAETWSREPERAVARLDAALDGPEAWPAAARARLEARRGQLRVFLGRLEAATIGLRAARHRAGDPYLDLQLAAALAWRGDPEARSEALRLARSVRSDARLTRDGPLAIAASCLVGEAALEDGQPEDALRAFGEALGISEFASSDAASVLPLVGLARAHARGRAPGKAAPLAQRALERARRTGDRAGEARALMALAEAEPNPERFLEAAMVATSAPHRPLALEARLRAFAAGVGPREGLAEEAEAIGAKGASARLRRVS